MGASRNQKTAERIGALPEGTAKKPVESALQRHVRTWTTSHYSSFLDGLRRLYQQPVGSFFTCLVMAVALGLPIGWSVLLNNLERLSGSWQSAAQVLVFLNLSVSPNQAAELQKKITRLTGVASAQWISPEQALASFQQQSGLGEALKELPDNPLPGVIVVTPKAVDQSYLTQLREQLTALPEVAQVQLDMLWVERLNALLTLGNNFVLGLGGLLVAALLLVMGNTIRLHIENRRSEIEIIKLVGGTDSYVRRPFLYMGALYGAGAGLLSWALLGYTLAWLNDSVLRLASLYGSDFALLTISGQQGMLVLIAAIVLGYLGAWLAVWRHLHELAPQ